jgi:predicted branched-subunit amino acid permease
MELTDNDLKAIAQVRFKNHKELNWDRHYTIPMYSAWTISVILALFLGNFTRSIQPYVALAVIIIFVFGIMVYLSWDKKVKKPWVAKFIQHFKDTKELME